MRDVGQDVIDLIALKQKRMYVRATCYNMRSYFSTLTSSNAPGSAPAEDNQELTEYPGAVTRSGSYTYTVYAGGDERTVKALRNDSSTIHYPSYSSSSLICDGRPDASDTMITWKQGTSLYVGTINWSTYALSSRTQIGTLGVAGNNVPASMHILNSTMIACIYVKGGGFAARIYHNSGGWHLESEWDNAMIFPTVSLEVPSQTVFYTAAANLGGSSYDTVFYFTSPEDGSVWGVRYNPTTQRWSDTFLALQSDMSEFRCLNAILYNGNVLLVGQFSRNGDDIKHNPVGMVLKSTDGGKTFSIDQYSLISKLGYRFVGCISSNTFYFSDMNRIGVVEVGANFGNTSASSTVITNVGSFSANSAINNAEASLDLKAGDESYIGDSNVARLNRCKIEIGYLDEVTGTDYIRYSDYDTYIIQSVEPTFADGVRTFVLALVQEGFWRLQTQTPPYYTEIIGKSGIFDDLDDYGNMFVSGGAARTYTRFAMDLWGSDGWALDSTMTPLSILAQGGVDACLHTGGSSIEAFKSADIKESLGSQDYPELTAQTATAEIYGWARCAYGTTGDNNVTVGMGVYIDRGGVEMYLPCTLTSTYSRWTKNYPDSAAGSVPITYTLGTTEQPTQVGDKIKNFTIMISGADSSKWYIESIRVSNDIKIGFADDTWSNMDVIEADGSSTGGYELPGYGRYIMLSSKPYSAFDSIIGATFQAIPGDDPTDTYGTSGCGLVLLAEDADNCLVVRWSIIDDTIYLVKVRNGVETSLDSGSSVGGNIIRIVAIHKGINIRVLATSLDALSYQEVINYDWNQHDPMATIGEESLHVGIYMEKSPANFRTSGFGVDDGNVIPVLIGEDVTAGFDNFTSTGKASINDHVYSYGGKSASAWMRGPYQFRSSYTTGEHVHDGVTYPPGNYYDIRLYSNVSNGSNSTLFQGYAFASNVGFTRKINLDDWQTGIPDGDWNDGGPSARSSHTDSVSNEKEHTSLGKLALSDKIYIVPSLYAIGSADAKAPISHSWGARCYQYATEVYRCFEFFGFSGDNELTVKNMIDKVARSVGAEATFSGDFTASSINLTANTPFTIF